MASRASLMLPPDSHDTIAQTGRSPGWGAPLHYRAEVGSTNDVAAELAAEGASEGTTVVAGTQTVGRGRHGRGWFSPPGAGLYVSVVLRPGLHAMAPARWPLLTLAAAVAVARAVRRISGIAAQIKWPNDIVVARAGETRWRKVAGILAESHSVADLHPGAQDTGDGGGQAGHVVVGIGVNVKRVAVPAPLDEIATSIEMQCGNVPEPGALLVAVLEELHAEYVALATRSRGARQLVADWRALSPSSEGAEVEWQAHDHVMRGVTAGLDQDGALLVRTASGVERVVAGAVRWIQE